MRNETDRPDWHHCQRSRKSGEINTSNVLAQKKQTWHGAIFAFAFFPDNLEQYRFQFRGLNLQLSVETRSVLGQAARHAITWCGRTHHRVWLACATGPSLQSQCRGLAECHFTCQLVFYAQSTAKVTPGWNTNKMTSDTVFIMPRHISLLLMIG